MEIRLLSLSSLILLLASCSPATTSEEASANSGTVGELLQANEADFSYPIYTSFDEIAPLFEQQGADTYVVNFWATWCQPCVEELPYFERLAEETDAKVIMVSLDFKRDVRTKLKQFVEQRKLKLPVVAFTDDDYNAWIDRVDPSWGGAIPVTLIYRGEDRRFHDTKFDSYEELKEAVTDLS